VVDKNEGLSIKYSLVFNYDNSGLVFINCKKEIDSSLEEQMVSDLVDRIPEDISRVDIHFCKWGGWAIHDGSYDRLLY
jgi:hypothetical protein